MAQTHPTISIIIPTYNAAEFIARSVESALQQTYAPLEIIIVDHSSDNTFEIAQTLAAAHPCIRVYRVAAEGVSAARNEGLAHATGECITYLDADDALEPTMLEELVGLLQETGADIAGCDFRDGDGSITVYHGKEIIAQAILEEHDTRVWSKLYRRSAIQDVHFLENLTIGEDMLYLLSAALRSDLTYALVRRRLYRYTINPMGAMERPFTRSYMDQIACWDYAEGLLTAHDAGILGGAGNAMYREGRVGEADDPVCAAGISGETVDTAHSENRSQSRANTVREAAECKNTAGQAAACSVVARKNAERENGVHKAAARKDVLLTPETYARLSAIQTVSAILVASKLARLPRAERSRYVAEWNTARESLRRYRENRKARDYYPPGYAIKAALLEHIPSLFCLLCRK